MAAQPTQAESPTAAVVATPMAVPAASGKGAEPAPAPTFAGDLTAVLSAAKLSHYEDALRELGCALPEDLRDVQEGDLMEIGMKTIEVKRLLRVLAE